MPSSDAELEERGNGGDEISLGGGDGVDLYDAELLLPGDVPAHDMPTSKEKMEIIQGQCQVFFTLKWCQESILRASAQRGKHWNYLSSEGL